MRNFWCNFSINIRIISKQKEARLKQLYTLKPMQISKVTVNNLQFTLNLTWCSPIITRIKYCPGVPCDGIRNCPEFRYMYTKCNVKSCHFTNLLVIFRKFVAFAPYLRWPAAVSGVANAVMPPPWLGPCIEFDIQNWKHCEYSIRTIFCKSNEW